MRAVADSNQIRDHAFDGIQEYDNDLPRWWLALLWGTHVAAAIYILWYHFGPGELGPVALASEQRMVAVARVADSSGPVPEDVLRELSHDAQRSAHGKELFAKNNCATCHGAEATGLVGPNLRDDWWLHGSGMTDIVTSIADGRGNGLMPPQGKLLSRQEIIDLAVFIAGSNRDAKAEGKAPDPARDKRQPIDY